MKKMKRLLCVAMALILAVGLCTFPASAANEGANAESAEESYPFVFVHGLMGWGARSDLDSIVPYWGMTTGSLMEYLNSKGYESYSATVGPLSSAWDRACELYAQLTGTTVDYGAAHSAQKDHDRYGITYDTPLFEGWSADKKVNLIGHSFGGATIRLFLDILANGCPEEAAAAKADGTEVSPFFEGGRGDWVYSLTAISAPHNGTTFIETCDTSTQVVTDFMYKIGASLGMTKLKGVYDLQLEHFGITPQQGETDLEYLLRVMNSEEFLSHNDNAIYDLTIDNALKINDGIEIQDDVYYFSIAGDATHSVPLTGTEVPDAGMLVLLKPFGTMMGCYSDKYTDGGVYIDESWLPNDGMVNVVSGLYPFGSDLKCVKADGSRGYTVYDGYSAKNFSAGVWNVMPTVPFDHLAAAGGIFTNTITETRLFYLDVIDNITGTYGNAEAEADGLPFTDVPEDFWAYSYIKELYDLGVVNGKTETTFDPNGYVTRGQFVKMLACLSGVDPSEYDDCRFTDVSDCSVLAPYIEWAAENGIVLGYNDEQFRPDENISRQQIAVIICRYCDHEGIMLGEDMSGAAFTDEADIADYAYDSVKTLQKAGVITGYANGDGSFRFEPYGLATRAATCKILCMI